MKFKYTPKGGVSMVHAPQWQPTAKDLYEAGPQFYPQSYYFGKGDLGQPYKNPEPNWQMKGDLPTKMQAQMQDLYPIDRRLMGYMGRPTKYGKYWRDLMKGYGNEE